MSFVDTGLGWGCDSAYLVNTAGQRLMGVQNNSSLGYIKYNSGYAIGVWLKNTNLNIEGIVIFSTVDENVENSIEYGVSSDRTFGTGTYGSVTTTFDEKTVKWRMCHNLLAPRDISYQSSLPIIQSSESVGSGMGINQYLIYRSGFRLTNSMYVPVDFIFNNQTKEDTFEINVLKTTN